MLRPFFSIKSRPTVIIHMSRLITGTQTLKPEPKNLMLTAILQTFDLDL